MTKAGKLSQLADKARTLSAEKREVLSKPDQKKKQREEGDRRPAYIPAWDLPVGGLRSVRTADPKTHMPAEHLVRKQNGDPAGHAYGRAAEPPSVYRKLIPITLICSRYCFNAAEKKFPVDDGEGDFLQTDFLKRLAQL